LADTNSPGRITFVVVGAILLVPATLLVAKLWWTKNLQANSEANKRQTVNKGGAV